MNEMRAYLNLSNGDRQDFQVKVTEKLKDGVHAVYLDGFSNCPLDAEFGAGIEIELDQVNRWMADYRHSEFWCRPKFGAEIAENLHCHFSKIEWSAGGEKRHLTFSDDVFGPNYEALMEVIYKNGLSPTIICESAGTQADDALSMKKYYCSLK